MDNHNIKQVHHYVEEIFKKDSTGHDYDHMKRVARVAREIGIREGANAFICEAAGLLHDIGDSKLFEDPLAALENMDDFLLSISLTKEEINQINEAIQDVSFSKGKIPASLEGKIVQDADRLDAIGAIGIGRAFAYGGSKERKIFDEAEPGSTTIQHFYDKLLKLKGLIHTDYAKKIADERHTFMEIFLAQFYKEW